VVTNEIKPPSAKISDEQLARQPSGSSSDLTEDGVGAQGALLGLPVHRRRRAEGERGEPYSAAGPRPAPAPTGRGVPAGVAAAGGGRGRRGLPGAGLVSGVCREAGPGGRRGAPAQRGDETLGRGVPFPTTRPRRAAVRGRRPVGVRHWNVRPCAATGRVRSLSLSPRWLRVCFGLSTREGGGDTRRPDSRRGDYAVGSHVLERRGSLTNVGR
jgi:hypothetical protein